jgi:hypothetical protein
MNSKTRYAITILSAIVGFAVTANWSYYGNGLVTGCGFTGAEGCIGIWLAIIAGNLAIHLFAQPKANTAEVVDLMHEMNAKTLLESELHQLAARTAVKEAAETDYLAPIREFMESAPATLKSNVPANGTDATVPNGNGPLTDVVTLCQMATEQLHTATRASRCLTNIGTSQIPLTIPQIAHARMVGPYTDDIMTREPSWIQPIIAIEAEASTEKPTGFTEVVPETRTMVA